MTLTDPIELPSLEEIDKMDKQRQEAIESLETSNDHVKCQKCGVAIPIVGKLARPHSDTIAYVEKQICKRLG